MSAVPRLESDSSAIPPLANGDCLTSAEFERRYSVLHHVKKAQLIEGVVYMPEPVPMSHGRPHACLAGWLGQYAMHRPEAEGGVSSTVRLDNDNNVQPDVLLRLVQGGRSRLIDGFVAGPPELVAEVTHSADAIDLHAKKRAYRRNGVQEYIVWRTRDGELDWFELVDGDYVRREPPEQGIVESRVFPGLRLNVTALLAGDLDAVLRTQRDS